MTHPQRSSQRSRVTAPLSGTLGRTPLVQLLVFLARREKSGTLSIQVDGQESRVLFEDGAPAKAFTPWPVPYLGALLMRMGLLDALTYDETLTEARRSSSLHGAVLLERGVVAASSLQGALREQTGLRILEVFRRYGAASTFEFRANEDLLASWGGESTPVDPWRLLWCGSSLRSADPAAPEVLSMLGDIPVTVRPDAPLHRFGFGPQEHRAIQWMQSHPSSIERLLRTPWLPAERMQNMLHVLFLTRCLAFHAPPVDGAGGTDASDVRRESFPTVPRSGTMPRVSVPISIPASAPAAPTPEQVAPDGSGIGHARTAPDWGGHELEPASDAHDPPSRRTPRMRELQASVRRIYKAPSSRPPAPPRMPTPPPPPAESVGATSPASHPPSAFDAMRLLRDVRDERRHGDLAQAESLARKALEACPSDPLIRTELAWILALQPQRRQMGDLGEPLDLAREAIRQNPELDGPHFVQGIVFQALGLHKQAYQSFRQALANNRRCVDAATQLETYARRYRETGSLEPGPGSTPPSRLGAVLSRFFKA
jgi:Domain of unknown function (DUF4388)